MYPTMQTLQKQLKKQYSQKSNSSKKQQKKSVLQALQTNIVKYIQATNNNKTQKNKSIETMQCKQKKKYSHHTIQKEIQPCSITNKIKSNTTRQTFKNNHKKSIIASITNKYCKIHTGNK